MEWVEVSVETKTEAADLVTAAFTDIGAGGVEIDDPALINAYIDEGRWDYRDMERKPETGMVVVRSYLANDGELDGKVRTLKASLEYMKERGADLGTAKVSTNIRNDEDWVDNWKKYFHTDKVGKNLVIQPSWEEYEVQPDDIVLRLDPGAAFGTGTHPTTSMCLRALEELVKPDMTVFDVGTGSGVLAIAAAKLGASKVVAADYDATAVKSAKFNSAENGTESIIEIKQSDLLKEFSGKAKLITANLIADLVIRLFDELDDHLEKGGRLLASGIILSREEDVVAAAKLHGLFIVQRHEEKEWLALEIIREEDR
ncbi:MAG: 50S ribosomal protein L11 methyltransferase [Schwartzia succinivorans]|jgi:ribosomal protein L11 methyltransferase|uniref:50S ribosomal protein L11 methyltransferase n=1 Tax=Schwartzia succinivorans TaxID=55507 RepID=UPI002353F7FA|nr:50S ribosomal protein L11 methyltransferase [Schwartzia succinivorans]MBE6097105.1 50S ribosomal protein L11 methyltransferase [Schwartzia succinivorans]